MIAVIMAGGKGTRIASVASDIPKPMIPICGKPVLEHEIECLRSQGITQLIITVSHLGHIIMDYFGDGSGVSPVTGKPFGVSIEYYVEREQLGNAGALFRLRERLTEDFLLLNADVMFDVNFGRMMEFHRAHDAVATILTHPNSHPYDSGLVFADEKFAVTRWLTKEEEHPAYYRNRVNAGVHILSPRIFDYADVNAEAIGQVIPETGKTYKVDLDRMLLRPLAGKGVLFCYDSPEYVKDMGTPERYHAVEADCANGRITQRNLARKQRAVFLDRDGTINKYVGFLRKPEELELLPGAAEAIHAINDAGYLCIVVTNQPVIARGEVTYEQLETIHNKLETLLGEHGAYVDRIYYCPHHPHRGYAGEIPELKIECNCRKPKPGMLLQAKEDFNIDMAKSFMVGDSENDVLAGKAAGCRTVLIAPEGETEDETVASSLLAFVNRQLRG